MIRMKKLTLGILAALVLSIASSDDFEAKLDVDKDIELAAQEIKKKQVECLAKNIYHEAGGEPFEGKVAVAQVTVNRANSGKFPGDVCSVVSQRTTVFDKVICQFSWFCDKSAHRKKLDKELYAESEEIARRVLFDDLRLPHLHNALYFHNDSINPGWGRRKVAKIGRHIFYK